MLHVSCWVVAKYLQTCVELVETLVSLMGNSFWMEKRKGFFGGRREKSPMALSTSSLLPACTCRTSLPCCIHFKDTLLGQGRCEEHKEQGLSEHTEPCVCSAPCCHAGLNKPGAAAEAKRAHIHRGILSNVPKNVSEHFLQV